MRTLPIVLAVLLSACVLDEEPAPDDLTLGGGEAEVTTTNLVTWYLQHGPKGSDDLDLGLTTGRACFIAGLRGYGTVHIVARDGHWIAESNPTSSLQLTTVCVASPSLGLTSEVMWSSTAASSVLVATASPGRHCFLTAAGTYDDSPGSNASLFTYRGYWWLGGTSTDHRFGARCINTTAVINAASVAAPAGGTATIVAAANPGGVACALTGLGSTAEPLHIDLPWRAALRYQDGGWFLDASNGRSASATCFQ